MKRIIKLLLFPFCIFCFNDAHAQTYFRAEQTVTQPLQVIIENYTVVMLGKQIASETYANQFDKKNPYTYIQIIRDQLGSNYHILYQTNFTGKILFLAYSNNLSALINNADKPQNVFVNCIKRVNEYLSAVQNVEAAVNCMIDRLNYVAN